MNGDDILRALVDDSRVYLHYTDESGLQLIMLEGVIRPNSKGYVHFTQEPMSPERAFNDLFIAATTHAGRGSHIIALRLDVGLPMETTSLYEARVAQSVRVDQHGFLYAGVNPFR